MGEDLFDMETQPNNYVAAASTSKGKAILPKVLQTAKSVSLQVVTARTCIPQLPAVPTGLLNNNRAIMPPPLAFSNTAQRVPVGTINKTAASEVPVGDMRRTPIQYGTIC